MPVSLEGLGSQLQLTKDGPSVDFGTMRSIEWLKVPEWRYGHTAEGRGGLLSNLALLTAERTMQMRSEIEQ